MGLAGWAEVLVIGLGLWVLVAVPVGLLIGAVISRGQRAPSERDD